MNKTRILLLCSIFFSLFSANALAVTTTCTFTPLPAANTAPQQSNNLLWDGTTIHSFNASDVPVRCVSINFTISDPQADSMTWYIYQNTTLIDSGTGGNSTQTTTNISWFQQKTLYNLSFNVTDGSLWSNQSFWFTTNYSIPLFSDENPGNGSIITTTSCNWNITITDQTHFNWSLGCSNGQNTNGNMNTTGVFWLNLTNLSDSTLYTVYVNCSNGNNTVNASYIFTVMLPSTPSGDTSPGGGGGLFIPSDEDETTQPTVTEDGGGDFTLLVSGFLIIIMFIIFIIILRKKQKQERRG